jgi:hypothetical protein
MFPATAPFAMPGRIALGAAAWWEPVLATAVTFAAIAGLIMLAGRVYTGGILHGGTTLKLRDAWRRGSVSSNRGTPAATAFAAEGPPHARLSVRGPAVSKVTARKVNAILIVVAALLGAAVVVLANDVVWGIAASFGSYAVASRVARAWRPRRC